MVCAGTSDGGSAISPAISAAISSSTAEASEILQFKLHLIEQLGATLRAAAIELAPHLLNGELQMRDQHFGTRHICRRPCLCFDTLAALGNQRRLECAQYLLEENHRRSCDADQSVRNQALMMLHLVSYVSSPHSAGCLRLPGPQRMSPVDTFQHVAQLRRGNDHDAIGRRGPDEQYRRVALRWRERHPSR